MWGLLYHYPIYHLQTILVKTDPSYGNMCDAFQTARGGYRGTMGGCHRGEGMEGSCPLVITVEELSPPVLGKQIFIQILSKNLLNVLYLQSQVVKIQGQTEFWDR